MKQILKEYQHRIVVVEGKSLLLMMNVAQLT